MPKENTYYHNALRRALKNHNTASANNSNADYQPVLKAFHNFIENDIHVFVLGSSDNGGIYAYYDEEAEERVIPVFLSISNAMQYSMTVEGFQRKISLMPMSTILHLILKANAVDAVLVEPDELEFYAVGELLKDARDYEVNSHITLLNSKMTETAADMLVIPIDKKWSGKSKIEKEFSAYVTPKSRSLPEDVRFGDLAVNDNSCAALDTDYLAYCVFPGTSEMNENRIIWNCYEVLIRASKAMHAHSIAIPCVEFENNNSLRLIQISIAAMINLLSKNTDYPVEVYLVSDSARTIQAYQYVADSLYSE